MLDFRSICKHFFHAMALQIGDLISILYCSVFFLPAACKSDFCYSYFLLNRLCEKMQSLAGDVQILPQYSFWALFSSVCIPEMKWCLSQPPAQLTQSHTSCSWIWPLDLQLGTDEVRGIYDTADCISEFIYFAITQDPVSLVTFYLVFSKAYLVIIQFQKHVACTMRKSVVC